MADVLIHIGYRKAASTFMRELFINHPQLQYIHNGIAGFNSTKDIVLLENSDKLSYFVFSENFTYYRGNSPIKTRENIQKYQVNSCKMLFQLFPEAKILIITRAPLSSILSGYYESIKNGYHLNSSERLKLPIAKSNLLGHLDYNFLISLYYETFGKENTIVLPYELLKDKPDQFLSIIENSLGLSHVEIPVSPVNPSLTPNENYWYLKISRTIYSFFSIFGKTGLFFYSQYIKWMGKNRLKKKKLKFLVTILSFIFGKKQEVIEIPDEIITDIKKNNTILKTIPAFKNYLNAYC